MVPFSVKLSIPNRVIGPSKVITFDDGSLPLACFPLFPFVFLPCIVLTVLSLCRVSQTTGNSLIMLLSTISLLAGSVAAGAVLPDIERRQSFGFGIGVDLPFGSSSTQGSSSNQGPSIVPSTSGFNQAFPHLSTGGKATCVSGYVPVTASTNNNIKLAISLPKNQSQVTEFFVEEYSVGSTLAQDVNQGKQTVSGTWNIYATLCTPLLNAKPKSVQLLTHGVGVSSPWEAQGKRSPNIE